METREHSLSWEEARKPSKQERAWDLVQLCLGNYYCSFTSLQLCDCEMNSKHLFPLCESLCSSSCFDLTFGEKKGGEKNQKGKNLLLSPRMLHLVLVPERPCKFWERQKCCNWNPSAVLWPRHGQPSMAGGTEPSFGSCFKKYIFIILFI